MSNELTQQQQTTPFDGYGGDLATTAFAGANPAGAIGAPRGAGGGIDGAFGGGGGNGNGAATSAPRESLLHKMHLCLRGRYIWAMPLALALGGACGYLGFSSLYPVYRGEGLIQISVSTKDAVGNGTVLPNAEEYVQSQAMVAGSRTIVDKALQGPNWRATGILIDGNTQTRIADNLEVMHPPRTELIRVFYTDRNPEVAKNVVRAIVEAYRDFATTRTEMEEGKRLSVLTRRQEISRNQIRQLDDQLTAEVKKYGIPDLTPLLDAKVAEENRVEAALNAAQMALDGAKRKKGTKSALESFTENQIAMSGDQYMRGLLIHRDEIKDVIALERSRGVMDKSASMVLRQAQLDEQQKKIDRYAAEWREWQLMRSDDPTLGAEGVGRLLQMSEGFLEQQVGALQRKYDQIKANRTEMGTQAIAIQNLRRQRDEAEKERADLQRIIENLNMSAAMSSRLAVLSPGEVSMQPYKDRRLAAGALAGFAGFAFPIGVFMLWGAADKRYRFSDDANVGISNVPLLGILPRLPDQLADPEQAAVAAHCIHQIRIMLQVGPNPERRRVFMVTSASTGDGKTSLTMALGLSFAASGSKTLVIDCDMVGQGLTHRLKASNVPGLIETLNTGTLRGHVRKTATKGLYILPIGNAQADDAGSLSPSGIRQLLSACSEHFDIIVVDTGPILGSLEASVVATEADGVIMAVARGQQQPLVERAIRHLRSIGANIFGVVFNRAEQRDFQRSVPSASIRSMSAKPTPPRALLSDSDESSRFGPLARSVASCLPASSGSTNGHANGHANGNANGSVNGNGVATAAPAPAAEKEDAAA